MNEKQVILITGAGGFLGTYLAEACVEKGYSIYGIDRNPPHDPTLWTGFSKILLEESEPGKLFAGIKFTTCFHLAGSASVPYSVLHPYDDFEGQLPGMAKLLEYIIRGQRQCHIVFFSSAAVYGNPQSLPVNEAALPQPISPYGIHKLVAEDMLRHYSAVFEITGSIIRIFSAYGNGQKKQLLWDALSKYRESIKNNMKNVTFSGTGKESRDFIHARDIAAASLLVGSTPVPGKIQIINVANGEDVAIDNILSSLFKLLPVPLFIHFDGHASAGYPIHWKADISRLKQIGYVSSIDIKKGLAEYVEWFNSQLQDV